ncbi:hypothetical protein ACFJGV_15055 [Cnuibacter sp. UC19_7]|uniref:hypothetical protein n=1 Tax=Cnuibacter sp. UC19_7 TaxID=3350166 RepID=UPI00366A86B7
MQLLDGSWKPFRKSRLGELEDLDRLAAVYAAIAQLDRIIQPTNVARSAATPDHLEYDREAIARCGFTDVTVARHVRNLLVASQHAISRDVDPAAVVASVAFDASALAEILGRNLSEAGERSAA